MSKLAYKRSLSAHRRLRDKYFRMGNSDKNRALGNYHSDCVGIQSDKKRILSKSERKRLFSYWWESEVNDKKIKYPKI